ncbi:hypothetical protein [Flagellimonas lutimaris]|uniref:hypothetical protein n=1 Tax=Flagellimonas lutimaris TaxID=475082 RepID=UPI0015FF8EBC|nr:hypothetical protein [Allomuricauda lutimaris]
MKSPIRVTEILKLIAFVPQKASKEAKLGFVKKKVNSDKVPEHLDFSSDDRGLFI